MNIFPSIPKNLKGDLDKAKIQKNIEKQHAAYKYKLNCNKLAMSVIDI